MSWISSGLIVMGTSILLTQRKAANEFAAPDGLTVTQIQKAVQMIGACFSGAAGIASYDPAYDKADHVLTAGIKIIKSILEVTRRPCA